MATQVAERVFVDTNIWVNATVPAAPDQELRKNKTGDLLLQTADFVADVATTSLAPSSYFARVWQRRPRRMSTDLTTLLERLMAW
jgi:hypothetical protein